MALDATNKKRKKRKSRIFFSNFLICQKNFLELLIGFGKIKIKILLF